MIYSFENVDTGLEEEHWMSMNELDQFIIDNPKLRKIITKSGGFIPGINQKPDEGFRDILREIKKVNPGSTIDTFD